MNTIYSAAVSADLVVFSVSVGQAASKPADNSPAAQARSMIEQIDSWSASVADRVDQLSMNAMSTGDLSASEIVGLNMLKEDVNKIGGALRLLEAEQGSLVS
jgi:hypothetical protein